MITYTATKVGGTTTALSAMAQKEIANSSSKAVCQYCCSKLHTSVIVIWHGSTSTSAFFTSSSPSAAVAVLQGVDWHDVRDIGLARLDLQQEQLLGLILNVKGTSLWSRLMGGRHWLALRKMGGIW